MLQKKLFNVILTLALIAIAAPILHATPTTSTIHSAASGRWDACIGDWIVNGHEAACGQDECFIVAIHPRSGNQNTFEGILTLKGTRKEPIGTSILQFTKIGNEYWGDLKHPVCSPSTNPFKMTLYFVDGYFITSTQTKQLYIGNQANQQKTLIQHIAIKTNSEASNSSSITASSIFTLSPSASPKAASLPERPSGNGYRAIDSITGGPKTVAIKGYFRKNGTYVKPRYHSKPRR